MQPTPSAESVRLDLHPTLPIRPKLLPAVLLVDDDPRKLAALKVVLAPLEIRLVVANSGAEALRHLLREEFALILLDVQMADMDGFETAAFIRRRAVSARTPIIFITAFDQAEVDIERGYGVGAVDFLTSPMVPGVLRTKVEAIVSRQRDRTELLQQIEEARSAKETASDYRNMTAHQIRGPLSVISGYLAMLADGSLTPESEAWPQVLEVLVAKALAIEQLATDLLLVARAEGPDSGRTTVDFNTEARAAGGRAAARADLLRIGLEFEGAESGCEVYGDASDVGRILDNLIGNAISYSVAGEHITVRLVDHDLPRIEVQDHGAGIPEGLRQRIFEPFYRVLPNLEANGTGLGLYLSRKLALRNLGKLELLGTELGLGSTFALSLPRCEPMAGAVPMS